MQHHVMERLIEVAQIITRNQHVDGPTKPFGKEFFEQANGRWE